MKKTEHAILINSLKKAKERLVSEWQSLLDDYRHLQSYYKGTTPEGARNSYYTEHWINSGFESEGLFNLHFRELPDEILANRAERNNLVEGIKLAKLKLKEAQKV